MNISREKASFNGPMDACEKFNAHVSGISESEADSALTFSNDLETMLKLGRPGIAAGQACCVFLMLKEIYDMGYDIALHKRKEQP